MIRTEITDNGKRVNKVLVDYIANVADMRPVYRKFLPLYRKTVAAWMNAQRTPEGEKYAPLSDKYKKRKLKLYGQKPILQASGKMINDIKSGRGDWFQKITKKTMVFGLKGSKKYPALNYGSNKINLPERRFLTDKEGNLPKRGQVILLRLLQLDAREKIKKTERV